MGNVLPFSQNPESGRQDAEAAELVDIRLQVMRVGLEQATQAAALVLPEMAPVPAQPQQQTANLYHFPEAQEEYRDARAA